MAAARSSCNKINSLAMIVVGRVVLLTSLSGMVSRGWWWKVRELCCRQCSPPSVVSVLGKRVTSTIRIQIHYQNGLINDA